MPVNKPSAAHQAMLPKWERARDCYEGTDAVKARGPKYLPLLDDQKAELGGEGSQSYQDYKTRAMFYNATRRTVQGLGGSIFQKAMTIDGVPDSNKADLQDVTLSGESLEAFAYKSAIEELITGSYGILIDMAVEGGTRPYWVRHQAESIISWSTTRIGGAQVLTRVVIRETCEVPDPEDKFTAIAVEQYRVLELEPIGETFRYKQVVYKQDENKKDWIAGPDIVPLRRGAPLDFIPFVFDPDLAAPPLIDLVDVNLSHYRNMADLEHGLHFCGTPQLVITGAQQPRNPTTGEQEPLRFGSGRVIELNAVGSDAKILQANGEMLGALERADERKRRLMATLGARMLEEQARGSETATAVGMRHSGEHATLRTIAQDLERDSTTALQIHCWWQGTEAKPTDVKAKVELNKEFFALKATPDEIRAATEALQDGTISYDTYYELLQEGGWAREGVTAEEEQAAIAKEGAARDAKRQEQANAAARDALARGLPDPNAPPAPPVAKPPVPKAA